MNDASESLLQAAESDPQAARLLVERLYPLVVKIVRGLQFDRSWEEDLVQEVFLKVFARAGQFRGDAPLAHWVSRLAVSTCLDHRRVRRRRPELRWSDLGRREAELLSAELAGAKSEPVGDRLAAAELVERLLECLPARDALLLRLLDMEGQSVAEVQRRTGWNQTLVKVRAFRARRKLQKVLANLEKDSDRVKGK